MPSDFVVRRYTCSKCGHSSDDWSNMTRHVTKRACQNAEVLKQTFHIIAWTDDSEQAQAMRAANVPVLPGFHSGASVVDPPDTLTRAILAQPSVLVAGGSKECMAACEVLRDSLFRIVSCKGWPREQGTMAYLFRACKLSTTIPAALRNMGVRGNDVVYKGEAGLECMSKGRMGSTVLAWLVNILRDALVDAIDDEEDLDRLDVWQLVWDAWFERGSRRHTLEQAIMAYDQDRGRFAEMHKTLQDRVRQEARGVARMLDLLPPFLGKM
jgi:hypothetical protein